MDNDISNVSNGVKDNKMFIIVLVVIALIVSYFLLFRNIFKSRYTKMEDEMVKYANDYVIRNNISTDREIYIDVTKLNIALDNDCYITSGIIYNNESLTPNLICSNYQSKVVKTNDQIKNYITLKGSDVVVLSKGMTYYEPGYVCNDIVTTLGNVGTEEGIYDLYYKTTNSNSIAQRKVIIIDNPDIANLFPVITINGEEIVYLKQGESYNELGARAYDYIDGDISSSITINGDINSNNLGEYFVSYTVTNSRGYKNSITRKVHVVSHDADLHIDYVLSPNSLTNGNVTIKLSINNEFNKIVYPDGSEGNELTYVVNANGTYKFYIYDMYNRVIQKEITINNIDNRPPEGSCIATMFYDRTEVKVSITSERSISSYEYLINGISSGGTQSNTFVSNTTNPSLVKVIVKDNINNKSELTCSLEGNLTRKIVTDGRGKNCLEGYNCYVQFDFSSSKYPYCSMSDNPSSCGGIGRNGCSITSVSNAIAAMGIKSKTGAIYNPFTVWEELYPINKSTGQCNGGCSGWTRMREAIVAAGLTAPRKITYLDRNNLSGILEHLKKGYPVIVRAEGKPFSSGRAHYLTLLSIRDDGYVFLSDSGNKEGTLKNKYNGKQYYVDTWIPADDLITGNVKEYLLVGPVGMFEGK